MRTRMAFGVAVATCLAAALAAQERPRPEAGTAFALVPCAVGPQKEAAECGHLTVPENRSLKDGRRIDVHFIVVRALQRPARHALFMFAGGPGEGSTVLVPWAFGWAAPVRADQDIVFVDQRGTGQSNPLNFDARADKTPAAAFGHVYDPGWLKRSRAALEANADLTQYATDIAVADVEDIRARLGYQTISLYGGSYGTRMAQAYLRRHPDRVRAVVLDGVVPFDSPLPLSYARTAQQAIDRTFAACAANPVCRAAHPHPARDFQTLLRRLSTTPAATAIRRQGRPEPVTMTAGDFAYAIRGMLYEGGPMVERLPDLIAQAVATGDVSQFAQRYFDREVRMEASIAFGLHLSVLCTEDVPFISEAEIPRATAGTFLGRYLVDEYRHACAVWPRGAIAADARTPVTARVPVLLLSGFFDPVTPPEFGERVARSLPLSRHIVSPAGGHGSVTGCARAAALHVLVKGTLHALPAVCGSDG